MVTVKVELVLKPIEHQFQYEWSLWDALFQSHFSMP